MGCDLFVSPTGFYKKSFNPRTHVGCDREWLFDFAIPEVFQSTHPRGVRQISVNTINQRGRFNPRTHVGCDVGRASTTVESSGFQSTHPRGVRPSVSFARIDFLKFQSTHPRGVRHVSNHMPQAVEFVSIHAPTWGATGSRMRCVRTPCFNPRTHVGCDEYGFVYTCQSCVSIHAPTWGATGYLFR